MTHTQGKCLKGIQETTPRTDPLGLLEGPHGENEGKKDAKTGSASEKRNNLASKKGHSKLAKRYQVPQGMDSSSKKTKR